MMVHREIQRNKGWSKGPAGRMPPHTVTLHVLKAIKTNRQIGSISQCIFVPGVLCRSQTTQASDCAIVWPASRQYSQINHTASASFTDSKLCPGCFSAAAFESLGPKAAGDGAKELDSLEPGVALEVFGKLPSKLLCNLPAACNKLLHVLADKQTIFKSCCRPAEGMPS